MKILKMIFFISAALIIITGVALRSAVPYISSENVAGGLVLKAGQSTLGDCPDTPNCVGSESSRSAQMVERFSIEHSSGNTLQILATIIEAQAGATIVKQNETYLHAEYTTKLMRYIDDVEFLLSDNGQSLQVRSASRLGKSDLGANAERVEALRSLFSGQL